MRKQILSILMLVGVMTQAQNIQQGLKSMDMEQYSSAQKTFEDLVKSKPTAEHYYYLGYFYAKRENAELAKANFEKGLAADKKYPLNQIGLGEVKLMQGDKAGAKAIFDEAISKSKSKNHDVLYRIGEAYIAHEGNKDANEAVRILEMAIKLKEATPDTYTALADAYVATQKPENGKEASKNYSFAINRSNGKSGKPSAKQAELRLLVPNPDYTDVLKEYKESMRLDPSYTPIYRKIGELYQKADRLDSAIVYYERYMERSERSEEVRYRYAVFLYQTKKYEKSLSELKALEGKVKYPEYYRWLAYAQQKSGMNQEAKTNLDKFMASNPKLTFASDYECYANIAFGLNNKEDAYNNLRKASEKELDNDKSVAYIERIADTVANQKMIDTASTRKNYQQVANIYDEIVEKYKGTKKKYTYQLYAGFYRTFSKEYDKADAGLAKAIAIAPDEASAYIFRADNKVAQNSKDAAEKAEAKPYYEKYLEITDKLITEAKDKEKAANRFKDNRAKAYRYLGNYFYGKKDLPKAKEYAQKVLDTKTAKADYIKYAEDMLKLKAIPTTTNTTPKTGTNPTPKTGTKKPN
jgi:tetratricopeptide (TPR) repeat protein